MTDSLHSICTEQQPVTRLLADDNHKDVGLNRFWSTQPVIHFDDQDAPDGPIRLYDASQISKEPFPLLEGFEWATLNLADEQELEELWQLLSDHYIEDGSKTFRFAYSRAFLRW